jgi:quercetin dioxygenase-like cupin family protein
MSDRFEDARGVIEDIFGPTDSVTRIFTVKDAVRGNHYHEHTTQWTLVLYGRLLMANGERETVLRTGEMLTHQPGDPHAWKALEDTICLVFTKGPRSGDQYETDTIRLDEPLLT